MFSPEEDIWSYFVKHDQLTDVVACPGIAFPSLANSCYVPTEEIFGTELEDEDNDEIVLNKQKITSSQQVKNNTMQGKGLPISSKKLTLKKY